ncbi:MAG: hypothetical protein JWM98_173 [Thermoleophilia bacterium]|nr:hypothetical protein [Thermoleophilia bacterium]
MGGTPVHVATSSTIAAPTTIASPADVVAPSQLFQLASEHFENATEWLGRRDGEPHEAPTVEAARAAIAEAHAGSRLLESALVPATPFRQRQAATSAMDDAWTAAASLVRYERAIAEFGDVPPATRDQLPIALQAMLDLAVARLDRASATIA